MAVEQAGAKLSSGWWGNSASFSISQIFGVFENILVKGVQIAQPHTGIDIAMPVGTKLFTPEHAKVADAGVDKYGNHFVRLLMDNGDNILLLHLDKIAVSTGQDLGPGSFLGTSGMSGLATGPHLHFEVDRSGKPVDPFSWLNTTAGDLSEIGSATGSAAGTAAATATNIGKITGAVANPRNWYRVGFFTLGVVIIGVGVFIYFFKEEVHAGEEAAGTIGGAAAKAA